MFTNEAVYRSRRIVGKFKQMAQAGRTPPEKYCFNLMLISRRHSIFDIGVGTGRTTGPLSDLFEKYVGIDFSQNMIADCQVAISNCGFTNNGCGQARIH